MSGAKPVTPKQLAIVLGSVGVFAAVGLWAAFGDRPNFTCRFGEGCVNYGSCTGRRLECIIASDADCRSSKECSESGECGLVGSDCHAVSQSDCEHSQSCKTKNECTFIADLQQCETPSEARKHQEDLRTKARDAASKTVAPWLALVQSAASGQETSASLAVTIATQQLDGFEVETPTPTLVAMDIGTGNWNEQRLPAALIRVNLPFVNRSAGERRQVCVVQVALHDEEFKMWRDMLTIGCQESDLAPRLSSWRSSHSYVSRERWPSSATPGGDAAVFDPVSTGSTPATNQ